MPIGADLAALPENERACVRKLVEAARIVDTLFLRQVSAGNETLLLDLARDRSPLGRARLRYFVLNKGPWSRLDHHAPFLPGRGGEAGGGHVLPGRRDEGRARRLDEGRCPRPSAPRRGGFFTTVRRTPDGKLHAVPYSTEYQPELARAAALLREAAALTEQPTLQSFLEKRAAAFLSNDYYASDVAWMELDACIEPTIGPYETYEDEWFGFKAAFEAFVTVRDDAETKKLARFSAQLQGLEDALPIDPKYRNPKLGALAPIRVVNVVFSAGDGNRGVQTAAFNLPNDERVVNKMGSKRVMLKNSQEAKFRKVLVPISGVALPPADARERRVRRVLHAHPHARADARPGSADDHRRGTRDHGPPGAEGELRHARGGEGGHLGAVGAAAPRRPGRPRQGPRAHDVHDLPRLRLPLHPLRPERGARPRRRDAAQLACSTRAPSRCGPTGPSRSTARRCGPASRRSRARS